MRDEANELAHLRGLPLGVGELTARASVCPFRGIFKRCLEESGTTSARDTPALSTDDEATDRGSLQALRSRPRHRGHRRHRARGSRLRLGDRQPLRRWHCCGLVAAIAERGRVELRAGVSLLDLSRPDALRGGSLRPTRSRNRRGSFVRRRVQTPLSSVGLVHSESRAHGRGDRACRPGCSCVDHGSPRRRCGRDARGGACYRRSWTLRFVALPRRLRQRIRVGDTFREILPLALAAVPLYAPVVAFLAFAYQQISPFTLPLFLVPALAAQRFFGLYQEQRILARGACRT